MAVIAVLGIVCMVWGVRRREGLLRPMRAHPAFVAGIWGALAATVIGALSNDSGPVIFNVGFLGLLLATAYGRGAPGAHTHRASTPHAESAGMRQAKPGTVV
jgi:hypothetical protein